MNKNDLYKTYMVTVFVRPEPIFENNQKVYFKGKTFKGAVIARNPEEVKESTINLLSKSFEGVKLTRRDITIRKCELANDFFINQSKANK